VKSKEGHFTQFYHNAHVHDKLVKSGATPAATTPAEFAALLKAELARWGKVVREKGIKPES